MTSPMMTVARTWLHSDDSADESARWVGLRTVENEHHR